MGELKLNEIPSLGKKDSQSEVQEGPKVQENPGLRESIEAKANHEGEFSLTEAIGDFFEGMVEGIKDFFVGIGEFFGLVDSNDDTKPADFELPDTREFGLRECADAAKEIFTPEVLTEWGLMSYEQREEKLTEYAHKVAEVLGVEINVVFQEGLVDQGAWGYNDGEGNIVLDASFVADPAQVLEAVSTIAHETRHQFQHDVVNNPENYEIDPATVAEWAAGFENYTVYCPTAEDPWGYFFNPVELDARFFGESVVRELTREIINNNQDNA
jgi:hypothetical protein